MALPDLRPYQATTVAQTEQALLASASHMVLQLATGGGKTVIAAHIILKALEGGKRVIFIVSDLSLIQQTIDRFISNGISIFDIGVIQAKHELTNWNKRVQIASRQTLERRNMPPTDIVIIDEVHKWSKSYEKWLKGAWSHIPVIGLSATPWRRGLGKYFKNLIIGATTQELIDAGHLSPFRVFAPASPDLSKVRTVAGDYRDDDLSEAMNKDGLVADVVDTWIARGKGRPTLCFAVDRTHAKHLQQQFIAGGVVAEYIDCFTAAPDRDAIAKRFHTGQVEVVCNVGCLTTGVDWDVRCIIWRGRPSQKCCSCKWSAEDCAPPTARTTASSSIIPTIISGSDSSPTYTTTSLMMVVNVRRRRRRRRRRYRRSALRARS